jgi:hypothetical protein
LVTAAHLLCIVAVTRSCLGQKNGRESEMIAVVTHYCSMIPDAVGPGFAMPSMTDLARYWQDPQSAYKKPTKIRGLRYSRFSSRAHREPFGCLFS